MATPKLFSYSLLAASALVLSTPAMAGVKTKHVKYDDLNLSAAAGQDELKARIKIAVKQVCSSPRAITIKERMDQRQCEAAAVARAMPKAEQTISAYVEKRRLASREMGAVVGN